MATEGKNEQRMSKEYLSLLNITYHYLVLLLRHFHEEQVVKNRLLLTTNRL